MRSNRAISRELRSQINRRANTLARCAYEEYRHRMLQEAEELLALGMEVDVEALQHQKPTVTHN